MDGTLTLNVVDQSPVRAGGTAADALRETIALAQATEALGYQRFWVAEHHNLPGFAGTCPEVLIGQIAARTNTIRVGSGGVMLSHYSALNVAVQVLCAETEQEARRLAASRNLVRLRIITGRGGGVPPVEEALAYPYIPQERAYLAQFSRANVDGNPRQVKEKLDTIAERYQATDLSIVTICYDFVARVRSYELVADVCGIAS